MRSSTMLHRQKNHKQGLIFQEFQYFKINIHEAKKETAAK